MERAYRVLSLMRTRGLSLRAAAAEAEIDPRTTLRMVKSALRKGHNGRYRATRSDHFLRVLYFPTTRGLTEIAVRDSRVATLISDYDRALDLFSRTGDASGLERFRNLTFRTVDGHDHAFLTDLDTIERLQYAGVLSFESLYARTS